MRKVFNSFFVLPFALCLVFSACSDENEVNTPPDDSSESGQNLWSDNEGYTDSDEGTFTVYSVGDVLGPWTKGSLDIHFISTGRGESAFLIFPDGTTLINDTAGATSISDSAEEHSAMLDAIPNDDYSSADVIEKYIEHFTSGISKGHIDYALASHYHEDHLGSVETTMSRGGDGTFYLSSMCDIGVRLPYRYFLHRGDFLPPSNRVYSNLQNFLKWTASAQGTVVEEFDPGALDQIKMVYAPEDYSNFHIRNLTCSGRYWTGEGENSEMKIPETYSDSDSQPDENCFSCALWLNFGKFDYYCGGDLQFSGRNAYSYKDAESFLVSVISAMDVNKANHHGTQNCNSQDFMNATTPTVWIANPWRSIQPNADTVDRVKKANSSCDLYASNFGPESEASKADFISTSGHVVVRVAPDASTYYVYVLEDLDFSYKVNKVKQYSTK